MKLGLLAEKIGYQSTGGEVEVEKAASLAAAGPNDIAFILDGKKSGEAKLATKAGALIIPPGVEVDRPSIIARNPKLAMAQAMRVLYPVKKPAPGVHPSAVIGADVVIGDNVHIAAHVSIGAGTRLGAGVTILAGARIGENCVIGDDSAIHENVVIYHSVHVGSRCAIYANSTIGADGFGYVEDDNGVHHKIPHVGTVVLEDDVEVGANSSIDRAMLDITLIKKGTKIDNQVQIGHNCVIGKNTVIAGCTGIGGSVTIADNVKVGGMVGITDNVSIASGVWLAAKTGVYHDLPEPGIYAGPMAMKRMDSNRFFLSRERIDKLSKRVKALETALNLKTE